MASLHRIFFVHDEIMKFGKVTTKKIVDVFEITTRQVQRDIREVTIRFYEPILNFIRHRKWHPNQTIKQTQFENKPCIELKIPVGDYTEITSMILSLAPNAEAVSPPDFREQWLQRVNGILERFK